MLAYAFQALNIAEYQSVSAEQFDNTADLFAVIIAKGIAVQVKRGLGKEYVLTTEQLSAPKGKINISDSVHLQATHARKLVCVYDELSENTYENRIIKSVATLLTKSIDVSKENKKRLRRAVLSFSHVEPVPVKSIDWSKVHYSRLSPTYKMLLNLCRFVLDGMIQTTFDGQIQLAKFVDDQRMSTLFEHFVLEYYRRHFPELKATPSYVEWDVDDGITDYLPAMRTDITLSNGPQSLIIDTKYYNQAFQHNPLYNKKTIHSDNLYQIYSYVKNKDVGATGNVSGILLYAKTDEEIAPDFTYSLSGNIISVKSLDLGTDFSNLSSQLNALVVPLISQIDS